MPLTLKNFYKQWWTPDPSRTIFYYDFQDSNNRLADSSWNGNDAGGIVSITYNNMWDECYAETTWIPSWISIGKYLWSYLSDFTILFYIYPIQSAYTACRPLMFIMANTQSPYNWATICFDPNGWFWHWDRVLFRMWWNSQYDYYTWDTVASGLYNWWHHIAMTRNSWTVSCYIDWQLEVNWNNDTYSFPTSGTAYWYILWNNNQWSEAFSAWAKWDKFILEKVWWSANDVQNYYNQTKSLYWIS